MLLLRLLVVLVGIGICGSVFAYFFTRDARYLALAWRLFRWALVVALVLILTNLNDLVGGSDVLAWAIVGVLATAFATGVAVGRRVG